MKTMLTALASVSLLVAPMAASPSAAMAQSHGGGAHGGGGFHAGARAGGFRGDEFRGSGFRNGGFRDGEFRGGRHFHDDFPFFFGGALFGFGLGAAFYDPWWYGYPVYYGYGPYYGDWGPGSTTPAALIGLPAAAGPGRAAAGLRIMELDAGQSKNHLDFPAEFQGRSNAALAVWRSKICCCPGSGVRRRL